MTQPDVIDGHARGERILAIGDPRAKASRRPVLRCGNCSPSGCIRRVRLGQSGMRGCKSGCRIGNFLFGRGDGFCCGRIIRLQRALCGSSAPVRRLLVVPAPGREPTRVRPCLAARASCLVSAFAVSPYLAFSAAIRAASDICAARAVASCFVASSAAATRPASDFSSRFLFRRRDLPFATSSSAASACETRCAAFAKSSSSANSCSAG